MYCVHVHVHVACRSIRYINPDNTITCTCTWDIDSAQWSVLYCRYIVHVCTYILCNNMHTCTVQHVYACYIGILGHAHVTVLGYAHVQCMHMYIVRNVLVGFGCLRSGQLCLWGKLCHTKATDWPMLNEPHTSHVECQTKNITGSTKEECV